MARTGLIQKFTRGATGSLANSFDDKAKARILAERDQRLAELRQRNTLQQQEFTTQRDERGFEQTLERDRQRTQQEKDLIDYKADKLPGGGIEPTANMKDVRAMVNAGVFDTEGDAWNFLNKSTQGGTIARVFGMLKSAQDEKTWLNPGDDDYKDAKTLFKEAEDIVTGTQDEPKRTPPPMFQFGNQGGGSAAQREAPKAALDALAKDPTLADQFKAKYKYLPAPYK